MARASRARPRDPLRLGKLMRAEDEKNWAKARRGMLVDLANLSDDRVKWFEERWRWEYLKRDDDPPLLDFRDRLRGMWTSGTVQAKGLAIGRWVRIATSNNRLSWCVLSGRQGRWVHPNYYLLPLSLAIAVSELGPQMARCPNPECPAPYFLKGRKTQRYCERPACIAYGQRQHKLKWWSAHGKEWAERRKQINK